MRLLSLLGHSSQTTLGVHIFKLNGATQSPFTFLRTVHTLVDLPKRKTKARVLQKPRVLEGGDGVCAAYCAKLPISLSRVSSFFDAASDEGFTTGNIEIFAADVVHVPLHVTESSHIHTAHAFMFSSGAAVFWGVPFAIRCALLKEIANMQEAPRNATGDLHDFSVPMEEFDHEFIYRIDGGKRGAAFINDEIRVSNFSDNLQLLALSYGLAQSVKLLIHEHAIDLLVIRTRSIPEELAEGGRIMMRDKEIKRFIGELLAARYSVSLVSDILDTPEFFWSHPELESLYHECSNAVELRQRARILDTRVQVIKDALDMLNSEITSASSHRVERAILGLIAVEVALEIFRIGPSIIS